MKIIPLAIRRHRQHIHTSSVCVPLPRLLLLLLLLTRSCLKLTVALLAHNCKALYFVFCILILSIAGGGKITSEASAFDASEKKIRMCPCAFFYIYLSFSRFCSQLVIHATTHKALVRIFTRPSRTNTHTQTHKYTQNCIQPSPSKISPHPSDLHTLLLSACILCV